MNCPKATCQPNGARPPVRQIRPERGRASGVKTVPAACAGTTQGHSANSLSALLNGCAVLEVHRALVRVSPSASRRTWE